MSGDPSSMSDADLMNAYATAKAQAAPPTDPRMMSDEQLKQAYHAAKGAQIGRGAFGDFTDQMARATTFGLADKASALAQTINPLIARGYDTLTGQPQGPWAEPGKSISDIYHEGLARSRAAGESYAETNPIASSVATGIGTITAGAPKAGLSAISLPGTAKQVIGQGATLGGLSGLGKTNDESLTEDIASTAEGMGLGGLTAGALRFASPYLAQGISAIGNSKLMHKLEWPALMAALFEGWHHPYLVGGGLAGLGAVKTAAGVNPRAAQGLIPLIAGQVGGMGPGFLAQPSNEAR